jgi:hypothetical protein
MELVIFVMLAAFCLSVRCPQMVNDSCELCQGRESCQLNVNFLWKWDVQAAWWFANLISTSRVFTPASVWSPPSSFQCSSCANPMFLSRPRWRKCRNTLLRKMQIRLSNVWFIIILGPGASNSTPWPLWTLRFGDGSYQTSLATA